MPARADIGLGRSGGRRCPGEAGGLQAWAGNCDFGGSRFAPLVGAGTSSPRLVRERCSVPSQLPTSAPLLRFLTLPTHTHEQTSEMPFMARPNRQAPDPGTTALLPQTSPVHNRTDIKRYLSLLDQTARLRIQAHTLSTAVSVPAPLQGERASPSRPAHIMSSDAGVAAVHVGVTLLLVEQKPRGPPLPVWKRVPPRYEGVFLGVDSRNPNAQSNSSNRPRSPSQRVCSASRLFKQCHCVASVPPALCFPSCSTFKLRIASFSHESPPGSMGSTKMGSGRGGA